MSRVTLVVRGASGLRSAPLGLKNEWAFPLQLRYDKLGYYNRFPEYILETKHEVWALIRTLGWCPSGFPTALVWIPWKVGITEGLEVGIAAADDRRQVNPSRHTIVIN